MASIFNHVFILRVPCVEAILAHINQTEDLHAVPSCLLLYGWGAQTLWGTPRPGAPPAAPPMPTSHQATLPGI